MATYITLIQEKLSTLFRSINLHFRLLRTRKNEDVLLDKETKLKVRENEVQTLTSDFEIIFIQIERNEQDQLVMKSEIEALQLHSELIQS